MGGGELQLSRYGAQNMYLNGNPQITYFKSVFKRYTNFSMEMIRLDFDGPQSLVYSSTGVDNTLSCKIARNGDLIDKIYFSINIPDIYSSIYTSTAADSVYPDGLSMEFQWVPNLGCQIIKECTLRIGSNKNKFQII